jgi:nicotinate-nucleotide--dimethylbenzimidazole phosphoribosyltransferase
MIVPAGPLISEAITRVQPLDERAMSLASARLDSLTKPIGSLGRLEELAVQIAGITGEPQPAARKKAIILMAADHGVAAEGVSAYPQSVTRQMVLNYLRGGAAISVLARQIEARIVVVDMGVIGDLPRDSGVIHNRIAEGTRNIAEEPAMSYAEAVASVEAGVRIGADAIGDGANLLLLGDMGIANTTASSAITAVLLGPPPEEVCGRGTGLDDEALARKSAMVRRAIEVNHPNQNDPLAVLAALGGFEIGGLAGVLLAGAAARVPVVLDGFITGAAALLAARLCRAVVPYLIAGHCSTEPGHRLILEALRLEPLLRLDLRLGEGTGAALAAHLTDDAIAVLIEMATFEEAGVANRRPD